MSFIAFYGFVVILAYNTYAYRKNLVLLILSGSAFTIYMTASNGLLTFILRKYDYLTVVNWCKMVLERNTPRLVKARAMSYKYVKINIGMCYYLGTTCTLLPAILGLFLPEEVYPKYTPPMPFMLPFLNPQSWFTWGLNTIVQTFAIYIYDAIGAIIFSFICVHYVALLAYVDEIVDKIGEMKLKIIDGQREMNVRVIVNARKVKHRNAWQHVWETERNNDGGGVDEVNYEARIKEVVEMYCDTIE